MLIVTNISESETFIWSTYNIHYRNIDMIINKKKVDPETPAKTTIYHSHEICIMTSSHNDGEESVHNSSAVGAHFIFLQTVYNIMLMWLG